MHSKHFRHGLVTEKLTWPGLYFFLICYLFLTPVSAWSESGLSKEKIPASLNPVFEHLLDLNRPDSTQTVNPEMIADLVGFVMAPKKKDRLYHADGPFEMTSAYHEFVFKKDLARILKLSYNPELPSFLTNPSSVRLSFWTHFGDGRKNLPKLWEFLNDDDMPVIVRGHEIIENTPDANTGGYYRYGLDRALILMKHNGNNLLISLSKQTGISDVGKKGVVLGSDDQWTYLYSDKKGLNKTGMGWVRSYMYDSFSAVVYYESPGEPTQVTCGAFKWINAGWKKINMVKEHHIHKGLQRYEQAFTSVVENPSLPDVSVMARTVRGISLMALGDLQQLNLSYLKSIRERYAGDKKLSSRWIADSLSDGQVEKMDRHELSAVVMLEYIKSLLGKPHDIDIASLSFP
jgi:hypothetical protein